MIIEEPKVAVPMEESSRGITLRAKKRLTRVQM